MSDLTDKFAAIFEESKDKGVCTGLLCEGQRSVYVATLPHGLTAEQAQVLVAVVNTTLLKTLAVLTGTEYTQAKAVCHEIERDASPNRRRNERTEF